MQETTLSAKVEKKPKALSTHVGPDVEIHQLEKKICEWILLQWEAEVAMLTTQIIVEQISFETFFENARRKKLFRCVYPFLAK